MCRNVTLIPWEKSEFSHLSLTSEISRLKLFYLRNNIQDPSTAMLQMNTLTLQGLNTTNEVLQKLVPGGLKLTIFCLNLPNVGITVYITT